MKKHLLVSEEDPYLEMLVSLHENLDSNCPQILESILLWRGYIVRCDNLKISLLEGSTKDDLFSFYRIAEQLGAKFDQLSKTTGSISNISNNKVNVRQIVSYIFGASNQHCSYSDSPVRQGSFLNTKYGFKYNTSELGSGVALLVKAIPRVACRVSFSYNGHHYAKGKALSLPSLNGRGCIKFTTNVDRAWFEAAGKILCERYGLPWKFHRCYDTGLLIENGDTLEIQATDFTGSSLAEQCFNRDRYLQKVARALFDDQLVDEIRAARPNDEDSAQNLTKQFGASEDPITLNYIDHRSIFSSQRDKTQKSPILTDMHTPSWLLDLSAQDAMTKPAPIKNILQGSFYYPCCALDGEPMKYLLRHWQSWVYVDYGVEKSKLSQSGRNGIGSLFPKGYKPIANRSIRVEELFQGEVTLDKPEFVAE